MGFGGAVIVFLVGDFDGGVVHVVLVHAAHGVAVFCDGDVVALFAADGGGVHPCAVVGEVGVVAGGGFGEGEGADDDGEVDVACFFAVLGVV